jgi:hypothetical protein
MSEQQRDEDAKEAGEREEPGEGNRYADKEYRDSTKRFLDRGGVEPAAKDAQRAMEDAGEREDLEQAERTGRSRIAEEDPELKK